MRRSSSGKSLIKPQLLPRRLGRARAKPNNVLMNQHSASGKMFACGGLDKTVQLWDTKQGKLRQRLTENTDSVYSIAFNPDGATLASASGDDNGTMLLWEITD